MNYAQRFGNYALQPYAPTLLPPSAFVQPQPQGPLVTGGSNVEPAGPKPTMNPFKPFQGMGGNSPQTQDIKDLASVGYADPSWGNLGQALHTAGIAMGPMGLLNSGIRYGLSQFGLVDSPFADLKGFGRLDPDLLNSINSPIAAAAQAQRARAFGVQAQRDRDRTAGPRGATDSHGQVRGGGTGHRGGGLTQGGPR